MMTLYRSTLPNYYHLVLVVGGRVKVDGLTPLYHVHGEYALCRYDRRLKWWRVPGQSRRT